MRISRRSLACHLIHGSPRCFLIALMNLPPDAMNKTNNATRRERRLSPLFAAQCGNF